MADLLLYLAASDEIVLSQITVLHSRVRIDGNVAINENAGFEIVFYGGSSSNITGDGTTVSATANGIDGILVADNAMLRAPGGVELIASQNGGAGIHAVLNASFSILGATVTLAGNKQNGLSVDSAQTPIDFQLVNSAAGDNHFDRQIGRFLFRPETVRFIRLCTAGLLSAAKGCRTEPPKSNSHFFQIGLPITYLCFLH